ncbi:hypothetical protein GCM10007425_17420 [Lysinibacillus alkalisoli]|uniref:HDOD domain-containing protein n=1 Tax=Lysinibacillus alkalisoli TaxID=1911548 RepID=A0A917LH94_9BACI|nr:HDOD domain-containing protein [Lysinibacillus alkalisoli]GGG23467.1 hypothetical protein GCM10007425_17420 [Lysinibacillus alkalisoli]
MEVFIGRQPILDLNEKVVAYELLYRNKSTNFFPEVNSDIATVDVLINTFMSMGINEVTKGRPAFINFTEKLLMSDMTDFLDPSKIVIEILEDVAITEELIQRVIQLKRLGYKVALDDFILDENITIYDKLFAHVDYIKVDFLLASLKQRLEIEHRIKSTFPHIKLLAEKVETREEFEIAKVSGYELFQGYFFEQPQVLKTTEIPVNTIQYLQLMTLLRDGEPNMTSVAENIERDISLSYKLLQLINTSPRRRAKVRSIKQAVMMLGIAQLRNWVSLLAIRETNKNHDTDVFSEVMHSALYRAKVCEILAKNQQQANYSEYFLIGMFSLMDALLQRPMSLVLQQIPFSDEICQTLSGGDTVMTPYLNLAIAMDKVDWKNIDEGVTYFEMTTQQLETIHREAYEWAEHAFM